MSEWQPIETMPRDGTPFYVWMPKWNGRGPMVRTAWRGYWENEFLNGGNPNPEAFKPEWWMSIDDLAPPNPQDQGSERT